MRPRWQVYKGKGIRMYCVTQKHVSLIFLPFWKIIVTAHMQMQLCAFDVMGHVVPNARQTYFIVVCIETLHRCCVFYLLACCLLTTSIYKCLLILPARLSGMQTKYPVSLCVHFPHHSPHTPSPRTRLMGDYLFRPVWWYLTSGWRNWEKPLVLLWLSLGTSTQRMTSSVP